MSTPRSYTCCMGYIKTYVIAQVNGVCERIIEPFHGRDLLNPGLYQSRFSQENCATFRYVGNRIHIKGIRFYGNVRETEGGEI